jgi:predicted enzyme related to lactoylglutathione lyase
MRNTIVPSCLAFGLLLGLAGVSAQMQGEPWKEPASHERHGATTSAIGYRGSLLVQMRVADLERAIKFYRDVLDFELVIHRDDLEWAELSFGLAGVKVGLGAGAEAKGSGTVSLNIGVRDVDAARTLLENRGVVFSGATLVVPGKVKLAEFADPDGNRIRLAQSLAPVRSEP